MDEQVNPLERDHSLSVVLPEGLEKNATVHGSKPVIDILVTLCARYHLNPSDYTVEVLSPNKNNISFKPNSPIGSLEAEKIVLKPRGVEEKIRRPYMPEASVRLIINYNKTHKAVVRVSPTVPLEMLLPMICDKCELKVETTVLLTDSQSKDLLDMTKTLNEHGLREVFAKDTTAKQLGDIEHQHKKPESVHAVTPTKVISPPPAQELPKKDKKQKKSPGFFCLFRKGKKKPASDGALSTPVSPCLSKQVGSGVNDQVASRSNTFQTDMSKKRRAPRPPMAASQSVPDNLRTSQLRGSQSFVEPTIRSTKRKAPPPPCASTQQDLQADSEVKGNVASLSAVEELREMDFCPSPSPSSSPQLCPPCSSSSSYRSSKHLNDITDRHLPTLQVKGLSDARSALAKILTTSISKGALVKPRNSTTFLKLCNGSNFPPMMQMCSDNEGFLAESEAVRSSSLPIQPEWDDSIQRSGMTTFKVVPFKVLMPHDPDRILNIPDQMGVDGEPEIEGFSKITDKSETETPLQSPEALFQKDQDSDTADCLPLSAGLDSYVCAELPLSKVGDTELKEEDTSEVTPAELTEFGDGEPSTDSQITLGVQSELLESPSRQSVSADMDQCGSNADEREVEEVHQAKEVEGEAEDDNFPPPPSPVFFNENKNVIKEAEKDAPSSPVPSSQPSRPASDSRPTTLSENLQVEPQLPDAGPKPLAKTRIAPSRFAQAVALAVQQPRFQRHEQVVSSQASSGPRSALASPPISI